MFKKPKNQNFCLLLKVFSFLLFPKKTMDLEEIVYLSYL